MTDHHPAETRCPSWRLRNLWCICGFSFHLSNCQCTVFHLAMWKFQCHSSYHLPIHQHMSCRLSSSTSRGHGLFRPWILLCRRKYHCVPAFRYRLYCLYRHTFPCHVAHSWRISLHIDFHLHRLFFLNREPCLLSSLRCSAFHLGIRFDLCRGERFPGIILHRWPLFHWYVFPSCFAYQ